MPGAPGSAAAKAGALKAQQAAEEQRRAEDLDEKQREAEAKASQRAQGDISASTCYPNEAADYFGESHAHRLRWAHAVNGLRVLRSALRGNAHFLEADVSAGALTEDKEVKESPTESPKEAKAVDVETSVVTSTGMPVIMAHYPTQRSSDLSLELFVAALMKHNAQVDGDGEDDASQMASQASEASPSKPRRSPFSEPVLNDNDQHQPLVRSASAADTVHEAAAFAGDLHRELEAADHSMIMACIGTRRATVLKARSSKKGVKLDFKVFECVEPALRHLQSVDAAKKLGGHLWLNADVFAGPGYPDRFFTPIDARNFVQLCAELVPEAVLSLSWGSSSLSTSRCYTEDMVNRMIELCMSPIVPRPIRTDRPDAKPPDPPEEPKARRLRGVSEEVYCLTPAASCQHITFAVAAEYALNSSANLLKLLNAVPSSSLTIFSGVGSLGISTRAIQDIINTYGTTRCFLDLRMTKPCRTCSQGGGCSLQ